MSVHNERVATFVLVHGGWSGAHGWRAVRLRTPIEDHPFGLAYSKATGSGRDAPGGGAFWNAAEHAKTAARWKSHEIASNHMVASNQPSELVAVLETLA